MDGMCAGAQAATQLMASSRDEVVGLVGTEGTDVRLQVVSLNSGEVHLDERLPGAAPPLVRGGSAAVVAAFLDSYKRKDESKGYRCELPALAMSAILTMGSWYAVWFLAT